MYDPTIGTWLSEDPEGFNAGDPNLHRYVSNNPVNSVDPSGLEEIKKTEAKLEFETVLDPKVSKGQDGSFSWEIKWKITNIQKGFKGGIIIQHVTAIGEGEDAKMKKVQCLHPKKPLLDFFDSDYWEVWTVSKQGVVSPSANDGKGNLYHDAFGLPPMKIKSNSKITMKGEAFFIEGLDISVLVNIGFSNDPMYGTGAQRLLSLDMRKKDARGTKSS